MNQLALEKTNKAKRIAEAILKHLEDWADGMSGDQGLEANTYCEKDKAWHDLLDLDAIAEGEINELVEEFMKIIEREL